MSREAVEAKLIKRAMEDSEFRKQLISDPKAVVEKEVGESFPDNVQIKVVEETADVAYIRLPAVTAEELSDKDLDNVAGGIFICNKFMSGW